MKYEHFYGYVRCDKPILFVIQSCKFKPVENNLYEIRDDFNGRASPWGCRNVTRSE